MLLLLVSGENSLNQNSIKHILVQTDMKRITILATILLASVSVAMAQWITPLATTSNASDQVTLNVELHPIQTLFINSSQEKVDLEYKLTTDYSAGVSSLQEDHLKIYSTGAFIVQVQSATNDIVRAGGAETISASTIKVKAELGSTNSLAGQTMAEVSLSTTPTNLINSGVGGVDRNFNVTYSGLDLNGYLNNYFNDENPTVYTTTVTYTIAAQ